MPFQLVCTSDDPLRDLEADYGHGVIHIAWNREAKRRTLLFGMVELLPHDVPPPAQEPEAGIRLPGRKHWVYAQRVVVSAARAIGYYRDCARGIALRPINNGSIPEPEEQSTERFELDSMEQEPEWPHLACASEDLPFLTKWHQTPRIHHLLPPTPGPRCQWNGKEREAASKWLQTQLHFNLEEFPEYWGSLHLILPNPVFSRIDVRRSPAVTDSPDWSILVQFHPRRGHSVCGLGLIVEATHPSGFTKCHQVLVESPLVQIQMNVSYTHVVEKVEDPVRGLLYASQPSVFINSFKLFGELARKRSISWPSRDGKSTESIEVDVVQELSARQDRKPGLRLSAFGRLAAARAAHKQREEAKVQAQRWFMDDREQATIAIQELIGTAHSRLYIVDPYFAVEELFRYVLATTRTTLTCRILSSKERLIDGKKLFPGIEGHEAGDQMQAALSRFDCNTDISKVDLRVMLGDRPEIHDRFLWVDDRVWLLGSSLNEFGSRGTMMLALADPVPVMEALNHAWENASPFEDWYKKRCRERRKSDE